jgi:hypothetical protein
MLIVVVVVVVEWTCKWQWDEWQGVVAIQSNRLDDKSAQIAAPSRSQSFHIS